MAQPQGDMGTQHKLKDIGSHTLKSFFQVKGVVVNYRKGQKQLKKNCSTSEKYLGQNTNLLPSLT